MSVGARSFLTPWLVGSQGGYDPFEEKPLTIRQFLSHSEYGDESRVAWPAVMNELSDIFGDDATRFAHREAALCWATGAGKGYVVSRAEAYCTYWLLNLRNPQAFFGLSPGSTIMILNQSITEDNARKAVFHDTKEAIERMPWFRRMGYLPNPRITSELRFDAKNIVIFPGTSKITSPAGYHLFVGVIDEAAFFEEMSRQDTGDINKAMEIYFSLRRRVGSRMGSRGMVLMISSPLHTDDFIEQMVQYILYGDPERNIPPPDNAYASRKALWDTRPGPETDEDGKWKPWRMTPWREEQVRNDGSIEVIREMMVPESALQEFQQDPVRALREYAGIASRIGLGYFWDPDIVWRPRPIAGLPGYNPDRHHPITEIDGIPRLNPDFYWRRPATDRTIHHGHADLSLTKDRVGISLGHIEGETLIRGVKQPLIFYDLLYEMKPPTIGQVDLGMIRDLIFELQRRGFNIKYWTYDQFQSADSIQQLNARRIEAAVLSVDADTIAYDTFKQAVIEGRADYYQSKPLWDCVKSLIVPRAGKIDHKKGGKKDLSDAAAAVARTLTERWANEVAPAATSVANPTVAAVIASRGIGGRREGPY